MFSSILDMQLKLDQEKVARQYAENRLLEVEKYKSELSVDIKQYEQQIAHLKTFSELYFQLPYILGYKQVYVDYMSNLDL
jgi:hypothetical protein